MTYLVLLYKIDSIIEMAQTPTEAEAIQEAEIVRNHIRNGYLPSNVVDEISKIVICEVKHQIKKQPATFEWGNTAFSPTKAEAAARKVIPACTSKDPDKMCEKCNCWKMTRAYCS